RPPPSRSRAGGPRPAARRWPRAPMPRPGSRLRGHAELDARWSEAAGRSSLSELHRRSARSDSASAARASSSGEAPWADEALRWLLRGFAAASRGRRREPVRAESTSEDGSGDTGGHPVGQRHLRRSERNCLGRSSGRRLPSKPTVNVFSLPISNRRRPAVEAHESYQLGSPSTSATVVSLLCPLLSLRVQILAKFGLSAGRRSPRVESG